MDARTLQFLTICYRYNKHVNPINRVYIPIIGTNDALIIHKQCTGNYFRIQAFETGIDKFEVINTIRAFFEHVPLYPEIIYIDFKDFPEFLDRYKDYTDLYGII